jgi:drug/metabolite transporter (DMT)-like permease
VLVRGVVTVLITAVWLHRIGVPPRGNRRTALVARGIFGTTALALFYAAIARLPLAEVTVLHYTNPLFTALIAAVWLGEQIGPRLVAGLLTGLLGVTALALPAFRDGVGRLSPEDLPWMGAVLGSALLAALAYTTVRDLRRTEHPLVIVFWFGLVMIPFAIVPALASWVAPTPREWAVLLLVALSALLGQVFLTRGLSLLPAGRAMAVGYVQVAFAALWGLLFFGDVPGAATVIGVGLIVVGALLANSRPASSAVA